MRPILYKQLGKYTLLSLGIYLILFLVLFAIECLVPSLSSRLLQWHDAAFVVGIPASIIGTAYILTIRNPLNYTGFIAGVLMSILLALQFALMEQWSLTFLQLCIFIPFMMVSLFKWRSPVLDDKPREDALSPTKLSTPYQLLNIFILILLTALDAGLLTHFKSAIVADDLLIQLMSGMMIGSSVLANFWMIYKKLDAWTWWIIYNFAGILFYVLVGNIFSLILFVIFLLVNARAAIAWRKLYRANSREVKK